MNFKHLMVWSFSFASFCGAHAPCANAALPHYSSSSAAEPSQYQRPEDLFSMIPFLGNLPRSFLFGDGYKVKLGTKDLRIDHMGTHSHDPANQRTCTLGLNYTTPVAGFFTSRFELPLLHSPDLSPSDWCRGSIGDYVASFSRGAEDHASLRLVLTAKF